MDPFQERAKAWDISLYFVAKFITPQYRKARCENQFLKQIFYGVLPAHPLHPSNIAKK
jgi:hypothetical protein